MAVRPYTVVDVPRLREKTAPSVEALTYDVAKTHMRVTASTDDAYITTLCKSARRFVEAYLNRSFINTTWEYSLDAFPADDGPIVLPRPRLSSVTSLVYTDYAGSATTLAATEYHVDTQNEPGQIVLRYGKAWPTTTLQTVNGILITYISGYGAAAANVPDDILHALKFLVAYWYEEREAAREVQGGSVVHLPLALESLLATHRVVRFP